MATTWHVKRTVEDDLQEAIRAAEERVAEGWRRDMKYGINCGKYRVYPRPESEFGDIVVMFPRKRMPGETPPRNTLP